MSQKTSFGKRKSRKSAKVKFRLTVSTALYCGNRIQFFHKEGFYETYQEARVHVTNLVLKIIQENNDRCSSSSKKGSTSFAIEKGFLTFSGKFYPSR